MRKRLLGLKDLKQTGFGSLRPRYEVLRCSGLHCSKFCPEEEGFTGLLSGLGVLTIYTVAVTVNQIQVLGGVVLMISS